MAAITAELVRDLREKTGAGMMDCKKALVEADGDMEKAVEYLRKHGIATASKKAGRIATEGLVEIALQGDGAALVEVNCETDFVAKNQDFQGFVKTVAEHLLKSQPVDLETLLTQTEAVSGKTFDLLVTELIAKIGEKISIRRFSYLKLQPGEKFGAYLHMGNKIGALVKLKGDAAKLHDEASKEIAMHVAAVSPRFVRRDQIPEEVKSKEKEIYLSQMKDSGKPLEIQEKIIEGKLAKFAGEICLAEQIFIKDSTGKKTVEKHLKEIDPNSSVLEFIRFQVGEGMAKKEEDFAAEVAKQLGK